MIFDMWVGLGQKVHVVNFGCGTAGPLGPLGSKMLNNALWLPNLVRRTTDASLRWCWPSWRSKVIRGQMGSTLCYGYHIWSKEPLMQAKNDDNLHRGQRSTKVKCGKLCAMAIIFGQKSCWCKLRMMMTFIEVKCQQSSNIVNYATWLPCLVRTTAEPSLGWWRPSWRSNVNRGHRSAEVIIINNGLWLPNLVRRAADASLG